MFPLLTALVAILIQQRVPYEMTVKSNCSERSDNLLENIQLEYINVLDSHHQFTVRDSEPSLSCRLKWVYLGEDTNVSPSGLHRGRPQQ